MTVRENMLIGGHTLGHYLTAVAQACASADISENDRAALEEAFIYLPLASRVSEEQAYGKKLQARIYFRCCYQ